MYNQNNEIYAEYKIISHANYTLKIIYTFKTIYDCDIKLKSFVSTLFASDKRRFFFKHSNVGFSYFVLVT